MGNIVLVARARVQAGTEDEMLLALLENASSSRREPGCVSYDVLRGDAGLFMTVERWRSRVDVDQHMASPHVAKLMQTIGRMLTAPPEIETLEEV
jgi:quinol monooxygenase YgiN